MRNAMGVVRIVVVVTSLALVRWAIGLTGVVRDRQTDERGFVQDQGSAVRKSREKHKSKRHKAKHRVVQRKSKKNKPVAGLDGCSGVVQHAGCDTGYVRCGSMCCLQEDLRNAKGNPAVHSVQCYPSGSYSVWGSKYALNSLGCNGVACCLAGKPYDCMQTHVRMRKNKNKNKPVHSRAS